MQKKIIIEVSGMSCSHCEKTVEDAAMSVNGVSKAKADAKKGTLVLKADDLSVTDSVKKAVADSVFSCR